MPPEAVLPRGWRLFAGTTALAIAVHLLHETAHMLGAMAFGVAGSMGTNTVRYSGEMSDLAAGTATAAGPALMLIFAFAAAFSTWRWAPSVLFIAFAQRALAAFFSAFFSPNDEAALGTLLGIGEWPLFALTVGITGALFIRRVMTDQLGWKWIGISYAGFIVAITVVVLGDGILPRIHF